MRSLPPSVNDSTLTLKPSALSIFFLAGLVFILVACASAGSPASAVEDYLHAVVSVDETGAVNSSCSDWEQQAVLESAAYQGVQTDLQNLECSLLAQEGNSALVTCNGKIVYSYAGGENQEDNLNGRVFSAVVEGGEWKMCGLASDSAVVETQATATTEPLVQVITNTPPPATVTPNYTPTPDTRPLPADWRTWPIIPTLSPWLADVYEAGLAQGNDAHHFSVAGDCQNIPEAFMGLYDDPDRYSFAANEQYLQETADYFSGSWARDGLAVDGGFNFPAIFTSLRADPTQCENNEDPLACEIRNWKPSFIFISMEFVYEGRTAENYDEYLRKAVQYALSKNVIPILLTKADNVEGHNLINLATARVAYDFDIPLINWWRAAQPLKDHGLDLARDAGKQPPNFHITYEAWSVRSYLGLKTLDTLRRSLLELGTGG